MILTPKPLASLSSGLLARKGQARPAMRPQGFASFPTAPQQLDDLGWNDMGDEGLTPIDTTASPLPDVLHERATLVESLTATPEVAAKVMPFEAPVADDGVPVAPVATLAAPKPSDGALNRVRQVRAVTTKAKAAFTLRLDAGRHLRLRLASALQNQSSQQLVTQALDIFLHSLPDVEALAISQSQTADARHAKGE